MAVVAGAATLQRHAVQGDEHRPATHLRQQMLRPTNRPHGTDSAGDAGVGVGQEQVPATGTPTGDGEEAQTDQRQGTAAPQGDDVVVSVGIDAAANDGDDDDDDDGDVPSLDGGKPRPQSRNNNSNTNTTATASNSSSSSRGRATRGRGTTVLSRLRRRFAPKWTWREGGQFVPEPDAAADGTVQAWASSTGVDGEGDGGVDGDRESLNTSGFVPENDGDGTDVVLALGRGHSGRHPLDDSSPSRASTQSRHSDSRPSSPPHSPNGTAATSSSPPPGVLPGSAVP